MQVPTALGALGSVAGQSTVLQATGDFLWLAVIFFILAVIAAVVGAQGVAGFSMTIAKWFVIIFLILAVISLFI